MRAFHPPGFKCWAWGSTFSLCKKPMKSKAKGPVTKKQETGRKTIPTNYTKTSLKNRPSAEHAHMSEEWEHSCTSLKHTARRRQAALQYWPSFNRGASSHVQGQFSSCMALQSICTLDHEKQRSLGKPWEALGSPCWATLCACRASSNSCRTFARRVLQICRRT